MSQPADPVTEGPVEIGEIAQMEPESEEAGKPVFMARLGQRSYITFAFLDSWDGITVYHAESHRKGRMAALLDAVCKRFMNSKPTQITFANVVSEWTEGRDLRNVLKGFEEETRVAEEGPHEGDKYQVLVGTWEPEQRHLEVDA